MLREINERLMTAKERVRAARKLEAMLREAQQSLRDEENKCSTLQERLASEKSDVDKLEGLSLTGLFYSVLGNKVEHLAKEREEYLSAKLKYDQSEHAVEEASAEIDRLQNEQAQYTQVDTEYDRLMREKELLLVGGANEQAEKLLALSERLADLQSDRKELKEAIQAGQEALGSLQQVSTNLRSAANWGTWDLLGGGMISTMAKHSKIDTAKQYAHEAQRRLRRFQEELADAGQRLGVSLEIGGFSKFADYFFDGLIADWVVQSKIQKASSACSTAISSVTSALNECRRRLAETEKEIESVSKSRREFIEQS